MADAVARGVRVDTVANRDQRNSVCLRDVDYRIHAHVEAGEGADKERGRIPRPVPPPGASGACFHRPFLGTREFSAEFGDPDDTERIGHSEDLGVMLHTIHFGPPVRMEWFTARLDDGVLHVPARGIEVPGGLAGEN